MIKTILTRTGCIMCDTEKFLEYLYVGDYGQENNIKADFLGLSKRIDGVKHKEVDLCKKMVVTISTQKGCAENCRFCDCHKVGFKGNVSRGELREQVVNCIRDSLCVHTDRFNLHLARMGEPSWNQDVLDFVEYDLRWDVLSEMDADVIHPVFTTMLPKANEKLFIALLRWCYIKNYVYNGEAGLQFSINSTDDAQRDWLFNNKSLSLDVISNIAYHLPKPIGRKYTLNFAVTEDTILDAKKLSSLFEKDKWIVKITPIHHTKAAMDNNIITKCGYVSYDVYEKFEQPLLDEGWDVIVFVPSIEEDEDRITCGNALLANM